MFRSEQGFLHWYFDYPLEQGLRHAKKQAQAKPNSRYFDYPLEQGLRRRDSF